MKLLRRAASSVVLVVALATPAVDAVATDSRQRGVDRSKCNAYAKTSKSTYGFDDGGCFMCTGKQGTDSLPLSGITLSEHCKRMCEADEACVSYSVGRAASLPAQEYHYGDGMRANCCLERREYPEGAFVGVPRGVTPTNNCERDAACWDRYEKKRGQGKVALDGTCVVPKTPSSYCAAVWEPYAYSDAEVQEKLEFIAKGCQFDDPHYETLLTAAAEQCQAEAFAESVTVSVISHPKALYVRATILDESLHND